MAPQLSPIRIDDVAQFGAGLEEAPRLGCHDDEGLEHGDDAFEVVDRSSHLQRHIGRHHCVLAVTGEVEAAAQRSLEMYTNRSRFVADHRDRLRHHSHGRSARSAWLVDSFLVAQRGACRLFRPAVSAGDVERLLMRVLRLVSMTAAHLHEPEIDEHLGGLDVVIRQHPQDCFEVRGRLVVRARALGLLGSEATEVDGSVETSDRRRRAEVASQLCIHRALIGLVDLLERLGNPQVEHRLHRRRHHLLDRVTHERMDELIRQQTTFDTDEEPTVDELVEPGADIVGTHLCGQ